MIYDYLLANLKPSSPFHLDRTFGQKGNVLSFFFRFANAPNSPPPPPPPYGGMVEVCSREAAAFKKNLVPPMLLFNSIFSQHTARNINYLRTQTKNCIIIANVKTLDRFYCKERERYLRTFPLLFRLGNSNSFF